MTVTVAQDTGIRPNQSGWGNSSDGQAWSTDSSLSIVSNELQCSSTSTGSVNMTLGGGQIINGDLYVRFSIQSTSLDNAGFTARYVNSTNLVRVQIHSGNITVRVVVAGVGTNLTPTTGVTIAANTFYRAHLNLNNNVYSINVWPDGQTEPTGWICQATDTGNNFIQPTKFGLFATVGVANDVIKFDSFLVTSNPPPIYVATNGNDSTGNGSIGNPYLTFAKAATVAQAGSVVNFQPGTYSMTTTPTLNSNGTATARIVYQSVVRWQALLRMTTDNDVVLNNGNYMDFVGFDLSGQGNGGFRTNASFGSIRSNYSHDYPCPDAATTGGAGLVDHYVNGTEGDNDFIGNWIVNVGTAGIGAGLVHGIYHQTHRGHVYNNVIINMPAGWGIKTSYYAESAIIEHNLIVNPQSGGYLNVTDPSIGVTMDNIYFANNIIRDNQGPFGSAIHEGTAPPAGNTGLNNVYTNNCIFGGTTSSTLNNGLVVTNTISSDPLMVNYNTSGTGDYHLTASSPCVDAGTAKNAPTTDYENFLRPRNNGYDIGPYEYQPSPMSKSDLITQYSRIMANAASSQIRLLATTYYGNATNSQEIYGELDALLQYELISQLHSMKSLTDVTSFLKSINYVANVLNDTPIVYYRLGEVVGASQAFDVSGRNMTGTINGGVTAGQVGALSQSSDMAMLFDGSTGYITLPLGVQPTNWPGITVEAWVKLTSSTFTASPHIVANSQLSDNKGVQFAINPNGANGFFRLGNGSTHSTATFSQTFTGSTWYHVVATWDGANIQLYVNGVTNGTPIGFAGPIAIISIPLNIGRNPSSISDYMPGTLDEVAIYNYALSAQRVLAHYNAGIYIAGMTF